MQIMHQAKELQLDMEKVRTGGLLKLLIKGIRQLCFQANLPLCKPSAALHAP